ASTSWSSTTDSLSVPGGEPPLPAEWEQKTTPTGEMFYVNCETKSTTWERPVAPPAAVTPGVVHDAGQPLPPEWEKNKTPTGEVYYVNYQTKETTWDRPAAPRPASFPAAVPETSKMAQPALSTPSEVVSAEDPLVKVEVGEQKQENASSEAGKGWLKKASTSWSSTTDSLSVPGGEPPLAAGWKQKTTPTGEMFYANYETKSTTWGRPVAPPAAVTPGVVHDAEQPLPP
ncbi:unnamed protein product, partial [Ascophyllum nodosum]